MSRTLYDPDSDRMMMPFHVSIKQLRHLQYHQQHSLLSASIFYNVKKDESSFQLLNTSKNRSVLNVGAECKFYLH